MENSSIYADSINNLYDSVIRTHKIQKTYLESLELKHKIFSIIKIVLTALTAVPTIMTAIFDQKVATISLACLTLGAIIFSEILDKIVTTDSINDFKDSSSKLWLLKNDILVLKDEINANKVSEDCVKNKLKLYINLFDACTNKLKTIPNRIVKRASMKLKVRKDEEIDFKVVNR